MDLVKSLIDIISLQKSRYINVIGYADEDSTLKMDEFFRLVVKGEIETDDEAAAHFFDTDSSDIIYRNFKSQFLKRLLNSLFFIDHKTIAKSDIDMAFANCAKEWAIAKLLFCRGETANALCITQRVLATALKYEFTETVVACSKRLRIYYSTRTTELKKYTEYDELFKKYEHLWHLENTAEGYYSKLVSMSTMTKAPKETIHEQAAAYYEQLLPHLNESSTYTFVKFTYLIHLMELTLKNEYQEAVDICDKALSFLDAKPFTSKSSVSSFNYQKLFCHIHLKQFDEGVKVAESSLEMEASGSFNWFKNRELSIILALHSKKYQEAWNIYQQATGHRCFKKLASITLEHWKIIEAYLAYLFLIQKIEPDALNGKPPKFRLGKFLNEVPVFSRDKRGMNIPILIVQVLIYIAKRNYGKAADRIEALERYCTRYLRNDATIRSNCFIRMLVQLPKSGFHRNGVTRRAEQYHKKMEAVSMDLQSPNAEIEIIPYEDLWQMATRDLTTRFYRRA